MQRIVKFQIVSGVDSSRVVASKIQGGLQISIGRFRFPCQRKLPLGHSRHLVVSRSMPQYGERAIRLSDAIESHAD